MNKIILILLFPFFSFSQTLEISLNKEKFIAKEDVAFVVKNNDSINRFLNIQLEKYDFNKNKWKSYSKDVFSKPFSMPLELTLIVEKKKSLDLKFKINEPELFDSPKYNKKKNNLIRENAKKGKFRIKIFNGINENNKSEYIYSKCFIVI
ncbi:hypothetical protein LIS90_11605 [Flavobacterium psychrophilum]|uniref:hypothetical protein n=1 Tax=Flavobacterium psychrophilum TaxID=96345 RepID=UPI000B7C4C41|nr:hypothetical protein [Flavobacterium psychrophilum]EKT3967317.1 hypothetical protein [Flavobacterium psychrophilum]MCB6231886.1 hypothetical protein [Flavobacterium psychrophilum]MCB6231894.1 hypothetical protein [Flavobacterium psychrophilum]MEB3380557.1 hypothetical protein [Flavobacterium psychrophilum]SNA66145.1 hypothetical protein FI146_120002 [Flavobacterium psychrophilum]